jgi:putative peptidoglycan lipid II flippase
VSEPRWVQSAWSVPVIYAAGIAATFLREVVLAALYGTGPEIEVFRLAFAASNLFSTSLGPVFVAAVLPMLVGLDAQPDDFRVAVRRVTIVNLAGVGLITAVAVLSAPLQARVLAPGFTAEALPYLEQQIALAWLFFLLASSSFAARAYLSHRGILWPGASATLIASGTIAAGCLVVAALPATTFEWTASLLTALAVLSGALILGVHLWALPRAGIRSSSGELPANSSIAPGWGLIAAAIALVVLCHCLNAVPRFIDRAVATNIGPGTVAALEYSFSVITVPGVLLGTVMVTMFFPGFLRAVEAQSRGAVLAFLRPLLIVLGLALMAGALISMLAPHLVELVYARGSFGATATAMTAEFLRWHAAGLVFMVATIVLVQALLAVRAFGILLLIAVARIVAKWLAVTLLVPRWGSSGLAASFIVPEALSALALAVIVWRRFRTPVPRAAGR